MALDDFLTLVLLLSSFLWVFLYVLRSNYWYKNPVKLPPGPFPLPIIGNILKLGPNPHHSLTKLSKTYGPIMHLKLGSMHAIVVSSPEIAKEILQKQDKVFSGRAVPHAARALNHDEFSVGWLPAEGKWRNLRKICKEQMFTMHKLEASEGLRQEKLKQLLDYLHECRTSKRVVNVGEVTFVTALNLLSATLFSVDFAHFDSSSAQEMKEIFQGMMKILGTPNLADYFPFLKMIDPQGLKRGNKFYFGKLFAKFDEIISKRLESRSKSSKDFPRKMDLLEVLLDLTRENDFDLSHNEIKHLLLDLIVAGTDTTTDTVHWAMTELMRNPEKMTKAKDELRTVIGDDKQVEEADISSLPYLRAVIKETFRYHPAGPFLIPHKAEANAEVNGYMVPRHAQIFVNVWAIGKDPKIWSNPDIFEPERFLESEIDYKGQHFELIAFGSGRRMCPGMPLAHVMVHLMLACLIHNFDWELEPGMKSQDLDMSEMFGLSLHKAVPLRGCLALLFDKLLLLFDEKQKQFWRSMRVPASQN